MAEKRCNECDALFEKHVFETHASVCLDCLCPRCVYCERRHWRGRVCVKSPEGQRRIALIRKYGTYDPWEMPLQ